MRSGIVQTSAVVEIWPDNQQAFQLFESMQTQWRIVSGGLPCGLDYAALPIVMELCEIAPAERPDLFNSLRVMEAEALKAIADRYGK